MEATEPNTLLVVGSQGKDSHERPSMLAHLQRNASRLAEHEAESPTRIRTARQRLEDANSLPPLDTLLGCLWESPGIAILAGDTGVGKSVLAVSIAHLITSSTTELLGLSCQATEKVLYYDFELTDRQFQKRFAGMSFPEGFIIGDTNPDSEDGGGFSFERIEYDLDRTGARIVILDNISALALKTTADADVSNGIMRGFKRLQNERGVSSLVLAHTPKLLRGQPLTLSDVAGSKGLSNFADSVFFISKSVQGPHIRYIKQVKNRTSEELQGVLVCEMTTASGYLGFALRGTDEEAAHLAQPLEERGPVQRKAQLSEIVLELPARLTNPQPAGRLESELATHFQVSGRTIRDRLSELTAPGGGYVVDSTGQLCVIVKEKAGREHLYSLRPEPAPAE